MNAQMVKDCLARKWPDGDYLLIEEAPEDSRRGGRKIDLLVLSLWPSRGLTLDAVEIKVSMSDWKRELGNGHKADFWWEHCNRFWLAVPEHMADKVKPDLPDTWGLLSCPLEGPPKVIVKAPHHDAAPLSWQTTVGVMRAAANCSLSALTRAKNEGREIGRNTALHEIERAGPDGALKRLREQVEKFEEASGLKISEPFADVTGLGKMVALVRAVDYDPSYLFKSVERHADYVISQMESTIKQARQAKKVAAKSQKHLRR
jgi:hypothetical protein